MRFVVIGAGAIGGVVGARLFQQGYDVVLVARGEHGRVIRERGLRVVDPGGSVVLPVPVTASPDEVTYRSDDVILLCVKGQDTELALTSLRRAAPPTIAVACVQNGVSNERAALRIFANVHAVCVILPAIHIEPGVVEAMTSPVTGILDIGRAPGSVDATSRSIAAAFAESTFVSQPRADIMRWKYRKLISNLTNAVDALAGPEARRSDLADRVRSEGERVLTSAGIDVATPEEDAERRGDIWPVSALANVARTGSSSWQSLARSAGAIEADHLNGEIVLLGRLHGVPTPLNCALQHVANEAARDRVAPGSWTVDALEREISRRA